MLHGDNVRKLNELDDDQNTPRSVSGGHLDAQLNRADQLWRSSLFVSDEARIILQERRLLGTLITTFEKAVLGKATNDTRYDLLGKIILHDPDPDRRDERLAAYYELDADDVQFMSSTHAARGAFLPSHYVTGEPTLQHLLTSLT